jgi:hypothetical protein
VLQIKPIRSILLACAYVCLFVFLLEKAVVPFLHQHHEVHSKVQGDSLQHANDCFACHIAHSMLHAELISAVSFTFIVLCIGVLQLFNVTLQTSNAIIFSSLRAPPLELTA